MQSDFRAARRLRGGCAPAAAASISMTVRYCCEPGAQIMYLRCELSLPRCALPTTRRLAAKLGMEALLAAVWAMPLPSGVPEGHRGIAFMAALKGLVSEGCCLCNTGPPHCQHEWELKISE